MSESSHRIQRVERELRELSSKYFIQSGKSFGRSLITVARAQVSKDLRHAKIFLSLLGADSTEQEEEFENIKQYEGDLGRFIGRNFRAKYSPKITFILDHGIEAMTDINSKIRRVAPDDE